MGWDKRWERPLYLLMYLQEWIDLDILPLNAYYLYTMLMRMQCRDFLVTSDNVLYDVAYQRIRHSKGGSHISVNIAFLSHKIIKCYQYCRESIVILLMDMYADEDWRLVKALLLSTDGCKLDALTCMIKTQWIILNLSASNQLTSWEVQEFKQQNSQLIVIQ